MNRPRRSYERERPGRPAPPPLFRTYAREEIPLQFHAARSFPRVLPSTTASKEPIITKPKPENTLSTCDSTTPLYEKLKSSQEEQQFRLITLLPSSDRDNIECVLERYALHPHWKRHTPLYEALSYEWGNAGKNLQTIVVNGQQIKITRNLWLALSHLMRNSEPRVLWIDALCIDQNNDEERSQQVSLMAQIYSDANLVISWLGLEQEYTITKSMAFMLKLFRSADEGSPEERHRDVGLGNKQWNENVSITPKLKRTREPFSEQEILEFIKQHRRVADKTILQYIKYMQSAQHRKPLLDADICEHIEVERERERNQVSHEGVLNFLKKRYYDGKRDMSENKIIQYSRNWLEWQDLTTFFSLEYWKRLWVIQEVVLARKVLIQCGQNSIEWFVMDKFLACLRYTCDSEYTGPQYISDLRHTPAAKLGHLRLQRTSPSRGFDLPTILATFRNSKCSDPRDKVYGLLGLSSNEWKDSLYPDYRRSLPELYGFLISKPRFRTDEELVSFSQFIQSLFGGIFHQCRDIPRGLSPETEACQQTDTFYTRGMISGTISIVGDAFTNIPEAKDLIMQWQSLYFHRVLSPKPAENLSTAVRDALSCIAKDVKRAVAIDSRLSYAYKGYQTISKPSWDKVILRYAGAEQPEHAETMKCKKENASLSSKLPDQIGNSSLAVSDFVRAATHVPSSPEKHDSSTPESCSCLFTSRIPISPKWMIGTRGQIGLVPGTAKEGDTICHFRGSDVAVVVRPFGSGWYHAVVGGAIIIRQWDEEAVKVHESSSEVFNYSVNPMRRGFIASSEVHDLMSFHFDRTALRLLTCQPSDLGGFSDAWTTYRAPVKEHFDLALGSTPL
jgi:hypothetical protein